MNLQGRKKLALNGSDWCILLCAGRSKWKSRISELAPPRVGISVAIPVKEEHFDMKSKLLRAPVAFPVLAAAFLGVVVIVSHASIPGPNGVISACYVAASGEIHLIDSTATCNPG